MDPDFNAAAWLVERQVRAGRGDAIAVEGAGGRLTYAQLLTRVGEVAAGLRSLGMRRDDRVIFVTSDDLAMFTGVLGAIWGGFVAVPISTMLGPDELAQLIHDSGAMVLVASTPFAANAAAATHGCPDLRVVVWDGDPGDAPLREGLDRMPFADLVARGAAAEVSERAVVHAGPDAWALWLYTSGTTGKAKGAMHRHLNIRLVCETYGAQVLAIEPEDRCMSVAKLFFAYGIGNSMFFPLSVGATTVLTAERPTPELMEQRVREGRPTLFFAVPTFFAGLLASGVSDDMFDGVRLAASAGETLPESVLTRVKDRFGLDVIDGLGSTECLHIFLSNRPDDIRPGTTGVAVPGYALELREVDGTLVPDGQPGTLFVRGESAALGYWRRADATRQVFQGEWVNTGDTYVRSNDGYYTCLGRANDLLKAGGIWVSPTEVEARLLAHDAVAEVAVVGLEDKDGLEKPVACVVAACPVAPEELDAWCREALAGFKRPRRYFFVAELPKTATGKVQRFRIRNQLTELVEQADSLA